VKNVAGAFSFKRPRDVDSKRIVRVDDAFTTGATMNECASVLIDAGVA